MILYWMKWSCFTLFLPYGSHHPDWTVHWHCHIEPAVRTMHPSGVDPEDHAGQSSVVLTAGMTRVRRSPIPTSDILHVIQYKSCIDDFAKVGFSKNTGGISVYILVWRKVIYLNISGRPLARPMSPVIASNSKASNIFICMCAEATIRSSLE